MTSSDAQGRLERILPEPSEVSDPASQEPALTLADRRRLHRRGRFRWRISLRALTTTALCVVALLGAWWAIAAAAPGQSVPESPSVAPLRSAPSARPSGAETPDSASSSAPIVVHVSGAVKHPGIVRLPAGARVFQAIEKADGALDTAELDALNLAEPLQDGHKVHVPQHGERVAGPSSGQVGSAGLSGGTRSSDQPGGSQPAPVHLNTASEEQLMTLPRIGKVLADRIIAWREQHGAFTKIEDLDAVDGIGPRLLEQLTPLIVLDG